MTLLSEIPIQEMINRFSAIEGVRVLDLQSHLGELKLALELPDKSELVAVINVMQDRAFLDVPETPKITPIAYMQVNEIITSYDLQSIAYSRKDI